MEQLPVGYASSSCMKKMKHNLAWAGFTTFSGGPRQVKKYQHLPLRTRSQRNMFDVKIRVFIW